MTIIFWSRRKPSISERNSRRAASKRVPPAPLAFMLAVRSMTTTVSPERCAEMEQRRIGQGGDQRDRGEQLQESKAGSCAAASPAASPAAARCSTRSQMNSAVVPIFNPRV